MDQEQRVDRMGANADSKKPKVIKRARRAAGAKAPPAPSKWIRNVNDYERRERREFQVARFG
jgi:hypothetical protein